MGDVLTLLTVILNIKIYFCFQVRVIMTFISASNSYFVVILTPPWGQTPPKLKHSSARRALSNRLSGPNHPSLQNTERCYPQVDLKSASAERLRRCVWRDLNVVDHAHAVDVSCVVIFDGLFEGVTSGWSGVGHLTPLWGFSPGPLPSPPGP